MEKKLLKALRKGRSEIVNLVWCNAISFLCNGIAEIGGSGWTRVTVSNASLDDSPNTFDRTHVQRGRWPRKKIGCDAKLLKNLSSNFGMMSRGSIMLEVNIPRMRIFSIVKRTIPRMEVSTNYPITVCSAINFPPIVHIPNY